MIAYRLDNVQKKFKDRTIVDIAHLELFSGRIYALIGPNGAGKTTLLDLLAFVEKPTSGSISFMGRAVSFSESHLKMLRRSVVLVNQKPILFSTTVFKNLEFGLKIRRIEKSLRRRIIQESLDLVGMRHMIAAPAHKLSGGETQRVALARALALSPKIILCDEPTSSVDAESQAAIIRLLKRINEEEGITIILTSHNRAEIGELTHKSLFIDNGRISDALYENLFPARLIQKSNGSVTCVINGSIQIPLHSKIIGNRRVLINPEQIEIAKEPGCKDSRKSIRGRIVQISMKHETVHIVLNVGVSVVATTTVERYRSLRPMVGEQVRIKITRDAVSVL